MNNFREKGTFQVLLQCWPHEPGARDLKTGLNPLGCRVKFLGFMVRVD